MSFYDFSELASFININSYTKNKEGVDRVGEQFRHLIEDLGYQTTTYEREAIGNHLYFHTNFDKNAKRILLLGHLDTVFPPQSFEGFKEDDEWIYGPGVCDMKGGNHVALEALRALHVKYGKINNIDMLLVSDEETGSDDSRYVTAELASRYDYCLVFEAAGVDGEVVIGRKGVATYMVEIEGKAAHAGNDYIKGINANLEAAHKIIAYTELTDLKAGTTVNVGKIEGGIGANTISPHAKLVLEARYTGGAERDRILRAIHEITHTSDVDGCKATLIGGIQRDVMEPCAEQITLVETFHKITSMAIPTEKRGGVSDANIASGQGAITLDGLGPFGDGDHTIHERASKKSYCERIEMVTKILDYFTNNGYSFENA